jgi:hypothetical protein
VAVRMVVMMFHRRIMEQATIVTQSR